LSDNRLTWTNSTRKLSELVPWERNPRQISEADAGRLAESLDQFGQIHAIAIGPDNEVYDGHQRRNVWAACDRYGSEYEVDVRVASRPLTEAEREKLVVYLHSGATGSWDWDQLSGWEPAALKDWGLDEGQLRGWNDDAANLALMLEAEEEEPPEDPGAQVDRAEELREKWQVELGQMWRLGEHRIICGDCTDAAVVERVMGGEKAELCVTDPPYGVEYDPAWRQRAAEEGHLAYAASRVGEVQNDDRTDWTEAFALCGASVVYCWHAGRLASSTQQMLEAAGYELRSQIIWAKPHFPISRGHYHWRHEPCWYAVKKGATANWLGGRKQTTVWDDITLDKNAEGGHGTQKPVECMQRPIRNHEGDVYEPFCGSGTTIIAAENEGRRCFAVEIEPKYVAVAIERWATMTNGTPELME